MYLHMIIGLLKGDIFAHKINTTLYDLELKFEKHTCFACVP